MKFQCVDLFMVILNLFEFCNSDVRFGSYIDFCKALFLGLKSGSGLYDQMTNGVLWAQRISCDLILCY